MANDTHSVGFYAAELLDKTAERKPNKTAIIAKEEELTFAALNQRVHALAGQLQQEGIRQGDRVGVLLPNSTAIPLTYFATQKIGAVTVILDARLKGIELQNVLTDADLKLLVVHSQLLPEVEEVFKAMARVPLWIVGAAGERSFETKFAAPATSLSLPKLKPGDDALILYTSGTTGEPKGVVLSYHNLTQYPAVMGDMGVTDSDTMRGCILPMSHIVGPIVCNEVAEKGYTLVIFDQFNPITLLEGIHKHHVTVFEGVPIIFQLILGVKNLADYDTSSVKIAAMMGTSVPLPTSSAHRRRYSCSEPSHQTMRCGRVRFATSITHCRRRWWRTYSGISGLAEPAGSRRVAASTATLSSRGIVVLMVTMVARSAPVVGASATIVDRWKVKFVCCAPRALSCLTL